MARRTAPKTSNSLEAIVAPTAHAVAGQREQAPAAGCSGYISKPLDTRTLGDQIREFLTEERLESIVSAESAFRESSLPKTTMQAWKWFRCATS
jgi:DNA-binding NarL/FixJ family response regulator